VIPGGVENKVFYSFAKTYALVFAIPPGFHHHPHVHVTIDLSGRQKSCPRWDINLASHAEIVSAGGAAWKPSKKRDAFRSGSCFLLAREPVWCSNPITRRLLKK
jgi:hypothetical protein